MSITSSSELDSEQHIPCSRLDCTRNSSSYAMKNYNEIYYFCRSHGKEVQVEENRWWDSMCFSSYAYRQSDRKNHEIRCEWEEGCTNPATDWAYYTYQDGVQKKRFHCQQHGIVDREQE